MNKTTRILLIALAAVMALHIGLSIAFVVEVYDMADSIRHRETQDMLSLHASIEDAEAEIKSLEQRLNAVSTTPPNTYVSCLCKDTCSCEKEPETVPQATTYTLRTYRDLIGVFDGEDRLIRVLNVYCASLPKSDQEVLSRGITVSSMDEVLQLLGVYS